MSKRKQYYISFLFAFIILSFLLLLLSIVGISYDIEWLNRFTNSGQLVGNMCGFLLGFKVIFDSFTLRQYISLKLFLFALGLFCVVANGFSVLKYFI